MCFISFISYKWKQFCYLGGADLAWLYHWLFDHLGRTQLWFCLRVTSGPHVLGGPVHFLHTLSQS